MQALRHDMNKCEAEVDHLQAVMRNFGLRTYLRVKEARQIVYHKNNAMAGQVVKVVGSGIVLLALVTYLVM